MLHICGYFTLGIFVITVLRSLNLPALWRTTNAGLIRRIFTRLFIVLSIFTGVFLVTGSTFFVLIFIIFQSWDGGFFLGIIAWIGILLAPLFTLIITVLWLRRLRKKSDDIEQSRKKEKQCSKAPTLLEKWLFKTPANATKTDLQLENNYNK